MDRRRIWLLPLCAALLALLCGGCTAVLSFFTPTEPDWENLPVSEAALPQQSPQARYYYSRLTNREKHAYSNIVAEIENLPERIEIPVLTQQQLSRVFEAVNYDNPHLLMMGTESRIEVTGVKAYFICSYRYGKEEYDRRSNELKQAVQKIQAGVKPGWGDFEKELYFHDAIVDNCSYSLTGAEDEGTPYGALVNKKAACEGYARAMKLLMDAAGLPCYLISGIGTNDAGQPENHMWNIVYIDKNYYHLDITWDDPISKGEGEQKRYLYFNLTDKEISADHSGFNSDNDCSATAAGYYRKMGLYFTDYNAAVRSAMTKKLVERINQGGNNLEIRFSSATVFDRAVNGLFPQEQVYRMLANANLSANKKIASNKAIKMEDHRKQVLNLIVFFEDEE